MANLSTCAVATLVWLVSTLAGQTVAPLQNPVNFMKTSKRPVTVRDSIESRMTLLDDYRNPGGVFNEGLLAQFSPDGKKFLVVLRNGNVKQNTNEYSILLFRTEEALHSPKPRPILTMASSSNREALKHVMWLDDNETIAFLGEHPGEMRQVYTFNVRTRILTKRTNETTDIDSFDMTPQGDRIAYVAEEPVTSLFAEKGQ